MNDTVSATPKKMSVKTIAVIGVLTAVTCILARIFASEFPGNTVLTGFLRFQARTAHTAPPLTKRFLYGTAAPDR